MLAANLKTVARPRELARITVRQYEAMLQAGVIEAGAPIELLDGLLVWKDRAARGGPPMTIGTLHNLGVKRLIDLAGRVRRRGCHLSIQGPVRLPGFNEPEPDGAILRGRPEDYRDEHPGPDAVCTVIEVADNSLDRDRTVKGRIYASAGIRCYVIVDVVGRQVELYTEPVAEQGRYARRAVRRSSQRVDLFVGGSRPLRVAAGALLP